MQLKRALLWSVLLHAGLLIARPPGAIVSAQKVSRAVELTFVPTFAAPERDAPVVKATPEKERLLRPSGARNDGGLGGRNDTPQVVKPSPPRIQESLPSAPPKKVEVRPKNVELHTVGAQAVTLPEKEFAQLTYRKQLREHLKKHLLYPAGSAEGIIRLRLALSPTGTIKQAFILEASDAQLAAACLEGVQSAAPFPPLPREMADAQADYEFLVQYRSN